MDNTSVATDDHTSNEPISAVPSSRHARPQTLHRSLTATSRKPLRSSPLAGPAVVSLSDPPIHTPGSNPDFLSPPESLHLRSKSKSAQTLARPVSLYANYSFDHSVGNSRSGHRRRPSTAPGPDADVTSRKRLSLTSPAVGSFFDDIHVPQRPSSVLVTLQEADNSVHDAGLRSRQRLSAHIPERGSLASSSGNNNGGNLMVPGSRVSLAESSGGASARVRYSYASSSASPSNRPVSFVIGADSDVEAEARQLWRSSYHSTAPKPILKHPSSHSSISRPSTPPSASSASSSASPTSPNSSSTVSDPGSPSKPLTTRLSGSFKEMDDSWYTFSPYATTPKFSRLGLAAPGVIMPISAKEMARRKNGLSPGASVIAGKQSSNTPAGKSVTRQTSLTTGRTSAARTSASRSTNTIPGDKAPTSDWLSIPPPARGGHRSQSQVRSKASQSSLHAKSHGVSPASSLAHSAASSAASSSSSLRSSSGSGHKGRSAASTPLSSAPSSVSLRSWKSVKASISLMASPPVALQPSSKAPSTSNSALSSTPQDEEVLPPHPVSSESSQNDLQAAEELPYLILVDDPVEAGSSHVLRGHHSSSGLLARMKGWRRRGKMVSKREEEVADLVIGEINKSGVDENGTMDDKGGVIDEVDVQEEVLPSEDTMVRLVVNVAKPDVVREGELNSGTNDVSPSSSISDDHDHDADDEREADRQVPKGDEARHRLQETARQGNSDNLAEAGFVHSPASAFSLLDLNPEPAITAATLIVIPIPSPNLHVADAMLSFLQQPSSEVQIEEVFRGELGPVPTSQIDLEANDPDVPCSTNSRVFDSKAPNFYSDPQMALPNQIQGESAHAEKRNATMRKLLNVIVCGACAAEPSSPIDSFPSVPLANL